MMFFVPLQNYLNVKFKSKRRYKDKYKSFTQELLLILRKEICKLPSCFKLWMQRMKGKLIKLR